MTSKQPLYYGKAKHSGKAIYLDRWELPNPNGFIIGYAGAGKSYAVKTEIITSILGTDDNIIIVDPDHEYIKITKTFCGEVIDLIENKGALRPFIKDENDSQKRITIYNMSKLGVNLKTKEGMAAVLENINTRIKNNFEKGIKTRVYFEELYWILQSEQNTNAFFELYNKSKKYNCIVTGITQNVEKLLEKDCTRDMVCNTQFIMLFKQYKADSKKLSVIFNLPPEMAEYIKFAETGSGVIYAEGIQLTVFTSGLPIEVKLLKTEINN